MSNKIDRSQLGYKFFKIETAVGLPDYYYYPKCNKTNMVNDTDEFQNLTQSIHWKKSFWHKAWLETHYQNGAGTEILSRKEVEALKVLYYPSDEQLLKGVSQKTLDSLGITCIESYDDAVRVADILQRFDRKSFLSDCWATKERYVDRYKKAVKHITCPETLKCLNGSVGEHAKAIDDLLVSNMFHLSHPFIANVIGNGFLDCNSPQSVKDEAEAMMGCPFVGQEGHPSVSSQARWLYESGYAESFYKKVGSFYEHFKGTLKHIKYVEAYKELEGVLTFYFKMLDACIKDHISPDENNVESLLDVGGC